MIELRTMIASDLAHVRCWLQEPHVVRWWLPDKTAEEELEKMTQKVSGFGEHATRMLMIIEKPAAAPWQKLLLAGVSGIPMTPTQMTPKPSAPRTAIAAWTTPSGTLKPLPAGWELN